MADVTCCGHYYEVGDELIGHSFTCPKCGNRTVFRKTFSGSSHSPMAAHLPMPTQGVAEKRVGWFQAWHVRKLNELNDRTRIKRGLGCGLVMVGLVLAQGSVARFLNPTTPEDVGEALTTTAITGAGVWLIVTGYRDKRRQFRLENRYCRFCGAGHLAEARYCVACGKETR